MEEEKEKLEKRIEERKKEFLTFFFTPYKWQDRAREVIKEKNTTAIIASNKVGKTASGVNIVISWLLGYEPWSVYTGKEEDAVSIGGQYYRKSSLGIDPPVDVIITGEDWKMHIGRTLVRELKKWMPKGWYSTKKNEQGVEYLWKIYNKSTVTIMCYSQDDDLFESFRAQGIWMDEPPPKSKYDAMSRGLLLDCGKTLLTLTPLKEAWILDELVLSGRSDIGIVDNLIITENEDLYADDVNYLKKYGLNEEEIKEFFNRLLYDKNGSPVSDRGKRASDYLYEKTNEELTGLKILKFIKDIDPSDVPCRVFGQFKSLIGRVLKEFNIETHIVEPFEIPTDWPVTVMVDFHLSKPQAVSYWAVNRQEIHYCIKEVWDNISAEEIADNIIRSRKSKAWNIEKVFIDPLSKGDTQYMRNAIGTDIRDTYSILEERLTEHGMSLAIASKDKESGIKNIKSMLRGRNGLPTCYIFRDCERHIYEVSRWIFDKDGKPAKDIDDHFMENWYRYTLTGAGYEVNKIRPLPAQSNYNWMSL